MVGETTTVSPLLGDSMDLEEHGRKKEKKRRRRRREREREVWKRGMGGRNKSSERGGDRGRMVTKDKGSNGTLAGPCTVGSPGPLWATLQ